MAGSAGRCDDAGVPRDEDINQLAHRLVAQSVGEDGHDDGNLASLLTFPRSLPDLYREARATAASLREADPGVEDDLPEGDRARLREFVDKVIREQK